jgi:hypothetical protein
MRGLPGDYLPGGAVQAPGGGEVLADLRADPEHAPGAAPGVPWEQGTDLGYLRGLLGYLGAVRPAAGAYEPGGCGPPVVAVRRERTDTTGHRQAEAARSSSQAAHRPCQTVA